MANERTILHVDMDAFFASIEQLDNPRLRGRPVLVGGEGPRGVVAAASYEARAFGCRSAQPTSIARRCCPHAVVVHPRGDRYGAVSRTVFAVLDTYTPLVESLSVDEAFLDVTGSKRLHGPGVVIAETIRRRIRQEVGLTASVGVAPNKFLAKIASDLNKPDGLTVIDDHWIATALPVLPIARMWGVGPATEERLHQFGVRTFRELAEVPEPQLRRVLGSDGRRLQRLARGVDDRAVVPAHDVRSVSRERTFAVDVNEPDRVRSALLHETEEVARRLRRKSLLARTVTVKIRYGDFETITRSLTLKEATDRTDLLWSAARGLFDRWCSTSFRPVRLIGMAASQLVADQAQDRQLTFFEPAGPSDEDGRRQLDRITDLIQGKFGPTAIHRGDRSLDRD